MKTRLLTAIMTVACASAAAQTAPKEFTVCMGDTLNGKVKSVTYSYYMFFEDGTLDEELFYDIGFSFDRQGRKTSAAGPGCVNMSYKYDPQGRLTLETGRPFADDPNYTSTTKYTYDAQGRLASMETDRINDDYKRITYAYDGEGRLAEEICYGWDYDAEWLDDNTPVYIEVDRETYSYDDGGTPDVQDQDQDLGNYSYDNAIVRIERDQAGHPVKQFLEKGQKISIIYDAEGRVIEKKCRDAWGKPEEIYLDTDGTYVRASRMTAEWGPGGMLAERTFYGADGNVVVSYVVDVKSDAKGNVTQWLDAIDGMPDTVYALVKRDITYY